MWQEPQAKNTRSGTAQRLTGSRLVKPGVRGWYIASRQVNQLSISLVNGRPAASPST